jgi:hypothetical protein
MYPRLLITYNILIYTIDKKHGKPLITVKHRQLHVIIKTPIDL